MGNKNSQIISNKTFDEMKMGSLLFSECNMQGYRSSMEDNYIMRELSLINHFICAVLDGHGGSDVSEYVRDNFDRVFETNDYWIKYKRLMEIREILLEIEGKSDFSEQTVFTMTDVENSKLIQELNSEVENILSIHHTNELIKKALEETFMEVDRLIIANVPICKTTGSCLTLTIITPTLIYCANIGDSRTILIRDDEIITGNSRAIPLSIDHKPDLSSERQRIINNGGYVKQKRIIGQLAVSRAFGDFDFKSDNIVDKNTMVTAFPDISIIERSGEDQFLVLGCDGLWDVMSNQNVVDFINMSYFDFDNHMLTYINYIIKRKEDEIKEKEEIYRKQANVIDLEIAEKNISAIKKEIKEIKENPRYNMKSEDMTVLQKLSFVNEMLVDRAIISRDNISIIIVKLK